MQIFDYLYQWKILITLGLVVGFRLVNLGLVFQMLFSALDTWVLVLVSMVLKNSLLNPSWLIARRSRLWWKECTCTECIVWCCVVIQWTVCSTTAGETTACRWRQLWCHSSSTLWLCCGYSGQSAVPQLVRPPPADDVSCDVIQRVRCVVLWLQWTVSSTTAGETTACRWRQLWCHSASTLCCVVITVDCLQYHSWWDHRLPMTSVMML